MKTSKLPKLQMFSAMFIFGTIGLFVRLLPLPSSVIAMCRGAIGALVLIIITLLQRRRVGYDAIRKNLKWLLPSGFFLGFNWILLFESYNYTTVAISTLCYYLAPILLILAAPVFLNEKLTARKLICVALALAGMICISGILQNGIPAVSELRGILLGLAAAVLYVSIILMNKQIHDISPFDKTITQLGISAVVMLVYNLLTQDLTALPLTPGVLALVLFVGVVHTGLPYFLYFGSMEHLSGQAIAIISYVDPVVAVLVSVLVLREPMHLTDWLGAVLILGAALVSELTSGEVSE